MRSKGGDVCLLENLHHKVAYECCTSPVYDEVKETNFTASPVLVIHQCCCLLIEEQQI